MEKKNAAISLWTLFKRDSDDANEKNAQKWTLIKNYLAINIAFVLVFSSKNSVNSLQPLIHQDKNLGNIGQLVSFCVNFATSMVLPQVVIDLIGFKFTIMVGIFLTTTFVIVQIYLNMTTLMIASVLAAFGSSFSWTTLNVYLTILSRNYSSLMSLDFKKVQTFSFGLNASLFALSYVIGYGVSGAILDTNLKNDSTAANHTFDYAAQCGISNCPSDKLPDSKSKPTDASFYTLFAVYMAFCLFSLLIAFFFMDDIKDLSQTDTENNEAKRMNIFGRFSSELENLSKLFLNIDLYLLFPLTFYSGFEITFIWFEYARAFSTCLLGVNYVGWTIIVFGFVTSVISFLMTYFLKLVGVQIGIIFSLMVSLIQCVFILSWTPSPESGKALVFMMAIGFALSMSVHFGQTRGLFGVYLAKHMQSAMSAANLSQTAGFFMGSLFSTYICTGVKAWTHFGVCILAIFSYSILLVKHILIENKNSINHSDGKSRPELVFLSRSQLTVVSDEIRV